MLVNYTRTLKFTNYDVHRVSAYRTKTLTVITLIEVNILLYEVRSQCTTFYAIAKSWKATATFEEGLSLEMQEMYVYLHYQLELNLR